MKKLPPFVKAYADELVAAAPPLTEEAKRAIRALGLYQRPPAEQDNADAGEPPAR